MSFDALFRLGWNTRWTALFAPHLDAGLVPGRVIRVDRDRVTVTTPSGDVVAVARDLPAVGDWVALADGRLTAVLPRSSALVRRDPGRPVPQVLAANADVAFVVAALDPAANLRRLERTLAVVWEGGCVPVVVLTKPDRCPDVAAKVAAVEAVALGVTVAVVNGLTGDGVDGLRAHLAADRTALFIGPSGAGKSTLANRLLGEERLATREVREDDRKGRHTTTARHLVVVPAGGVLIDTPGLRELAIWEAADGVGAAFADIDELAAGCRFRDCRHASEPGCAVLGRVDAGRLRNWRQLSDPIPPAERRRRDKIAQKAYRRDFKR
ncbi:MAG: ribosome small subunit-dependent GTPase A [Actinomycetota bacterium]|nr:ribosome small subunit-dependent GTPase A [Actinomycetota bacterium]